MKDPVRVVVTGAAGQIGYALLFRIASGEMPNFQTTKVVRIAVNSSTRGYCSEIFIPQLLHFPLRKR